MSKKRLDRREQRRAEAKVRQAAFDAEVRANVGGVITLAMARQMVRGQHKALYQAAQR